MLVVTKENSYGRMNVSAEKYTCSFLQNVIKLKRILSAIMMATVIGGVCIMKCTSSWWLFSSQSPSRFQNGELSRDTR